MFSGLKILSALEYVRPEVKISAKGRPFNVISIRTAGSAFFTYGDKELQVNEKNILIIPKNTEYSQQTAGERITAIHFEGDIPYDSLKSIKCSKNDQELFFEICEHFCKGNEYNICMAHSKLYALFARFSMDEAMSGSRNIIKDGYEIIRSRFTESSLKIETISAELNISSVYFRREFKKQFKMSPKEFLINLRLEHAATLLENNYCNVNEAAYQSGFSNPNYFSVVFKSRYGVPPLTFSKKKNY